MSTLIAQFYAATNELADFLKSQKLSKIHLEQLSNKRGVLTCEFERAKSQIVAEAILKKNNTLADIALRGFRTSSLYKTAAVEQDRATDDELNRLDARYSYLMKEIELAERKITTKSRSVLSMIGTAVCQLRSAICSLFKSDRVSGAQRRG